MNKRIILNKEKILIGVFFCTFAIISWAPTTKNSTLGTDSLRMVTRMMYFGSASIIALMTKWKKRILLLDFHLALTPVIYLSVQNLYSYAGLRGSTSAMLLCALFALQSSEIKSHVYKWIKRYLLVMAVVGIICYILFFLKSGIGYEIIPYYSRIGNEQWYIDYGICYLYHNKFQTRLCGLFNEPGWFGTFLAFDLCSEGLDFKKMSNVIICIAGVLTFSLAFLLIVVIYYVAKKAHDWKQWIWVVALFGFYIFILPNLETGNKYVDALIDRMIITEEGIAGDNRTTAIFEEELEKNLRGASALVGKGYGYHLTIGAGSVLSIKTYLMDFGILGTIFLFGPLFILLACRYRNSKSVVIFLICVAASLYQRPWLFETSNFYMTVAASAYIAKEGIVERKNNSSGVLV